MTNDKKDFDELNFLIQDKDKIVQSRNMSESKKRRNDRFILRGRVVRVDPWVD